MDSAEPLAQNTRVAKRFPSAYFVPYRTIFCSAGMAGHSHYCGLVLCGYAHAEQVNAAELAVLSLYPCLLQPVHTHFPFCDLALVVYHANVVDAGIRRSIG